MHIYSSLTAWVSQHPALTGLLGVIAALIAIWTSCKSGLQFLMRKVDVTWPDIPASRQINSDSRKRERLKQAVRKRLERAGLTYHLRQDIPSLITLWGFTICCAVFCTCLMTLEAVALYQRTFWFAFLLFACLAGIFRYLVDFLTILSGVFAFRIKLENSMAIVKVHLADMGVDKDDAQKYITETLQYMQQESATLLQEGVEN